MDQDPSQNRAAAIATIGYLAVTGCFFAIASKTDDGPVGYMIAGVLFAFAAVASFRRWRATK